MINKLHKLNIRVTLWVHPFANIDSINFLNGVKNGYWVKDINRKHPVLTESKVVFY